MASSSSGDVSGLAAALIGAGASVFGALVGGGFTLWAAVRQSGSERKAARLERSKQAAMDIAASWPVLEEALLDRAHGKNAANDLHKAFNAFSRTAAMQCIPVTDEELRRRIRGHINLALSSTLYADNPEQLSTKVQRLQTNGAEIAESIDAHYNDKPLPAYSGPLWPKSSSLEPAKKAKRRKLRKQEQSTGS
jgi:hypothetical protein